MIEGDTMDRVIPWKMEKLERGMRCEPVGIPRGMLRGYWVTERSSRVAGVVPGAKCLMGWCCRYLQGELVKDENAKIL